MESKLRWSVGTAYNLDYSALSPLGLQMSLLADSVVGWLEGQYHNL